MYAFESRVRFSETGKNGKLRLSALLDYFQDCAGFHTEDSGVPLAGLRAEGMIWVLNSWHVEISRLPAECEHVKITTNPYDFRGFFGHRNFLLEDVAGQRLAIADSLWTMVGTEHGYPVHVPAEIPARYGVGEPLEMPNMGRKIRVAGTPCLPERRFPVTAELLDSNGHMNNAQYVRIAEGALPENVSCRRLRVEYRRAVMPGEELTLRALEDGARRLELLCSGDEVCCVCEFLLE